MLLHQDGNSGKRLSGSWIRSIRFSSSVNCRSLVAFQTKTQTQKLSEPHKVCLLDSFDRLIARGLILTRAMQSGVSRKPHMNGTRVPGKEKVCGTPPTRDLYLMSESYPRWPAKSVKDEGSPVVEFGNSTLNMGGISYNAEHAEKRGGPAHSESSKRMVNSRQVLRNEGLRQRVGSVDVHRL